MALTVEVISVDRVLLHMKVHSDFDYFYSRGLTKGQETVGEYSKRARGWDGLDGRLWFLANSHFKQAWTAWRQGRKMTPGLKDRRTQDTHKGRSRKLSTWTTCYILQFKDLTDICIQTYNSTCSSGQAQRVTHGPYTCQHNIHVCIPCVLYDTL